MSERLGHGLAAECTTVLLTVSGLLKKERAAAQRENMRLRPAAQQHSPASAPQTRMAAGSGTRPGAASVASQPTAAPIRYCSKPLTSSPTLAGGHRLRGKVGGFLLRYT